VKIPAGRVIRDIITYVGGLSGLVYETVTSGTEKPTLIIAFAAMIGLPLFIRSDEARRSQANKIIEDSSDDHTSKDQS
jgi:hypothetical protein